MHKKLENKTPKYDRGPTDLLSGRPPVCILRRKSDLLPGCLGCWRGRDISFGQLWCHSCNSGTHQESNSRPWFIHVNGSQKRQSHFKLHPTNRFVGSGTPRQYWQWHRVGVQLWCKQQWLNLPRVARKFSRNWKHHSGSIGHHRGNRKHPQGL